MSKIVLSLTDVVDVVLKSGVSKATKVEQIKKRAPYSPSSDYYKPLREAIIQAHQNGFTKKIFSRNCNFLI